MTKYFTNNFSLINLYKKPSVKSEIVTQMIYGESFSISKKSKKWLKVKKLPMMTLVFPKENGMSL